jgi:hypothetical protein
MRKLWRRFLAAYRLSPAAVCEESRGPRDYHDWPDESEWIGPQHFHTYHCARCGKAFTI